VWQVGRWAGALQHSSANKRLATKLQRTRQFQADPVQRLQWRMPIMPLRFVFGLHNHQPVGNFGSVFEQAYHDSYWPFLELMEQYPEIPFTLHTSGCLLEWIVEHRPEYVARLKELVGRGQVEILGGGFYEPILTMLPRWDRQGQVRTYTEYLEEMFQCQVRGLWLAERVWEPELVSDLAQAGIEYTLLDDYHFRQAGLEDQQLFGWFLSEDEGWLLKVFPISEPLRYLVPWKTPEEAVAYLGEVAARYPDAVVVCADDGEKFGGWPETHKHCYTDGWLRRFFDLLRENRHWIRFCTLGQALDETTAQGTVYLPDSSYREMTEWALPTTKLQAYNRLVKSLAGDPREPDIKRFLRGGFWRNFKAKYPEVHEMYCRMLEVSQRLHHQAESDPRGFVEARQELYRAQCNCSYWHGAFGGLYVPHLRNAVYHHLIKSENTTLISQGETITLVDAEVQDFNLDTRAEVCLHNTSIVAYLNPHVGGSLYELDLCAINHNLLATLSRRPEAYHETIVQAAGGHKTESQVSKVVEGARFKQEGLEKQLQYDRYLRKSLIDHFYEPGVTITDLAAHREVELGDFIQAPYEYQVKRHRRAAHLILTREGHAAGAKIRLTKMLSLEAEGDTLAIRYALENLPPERALHFAVEFQFAGMAANQDDRYFHHDGQPRAGQLQTLKDLHDQGHIGLVDEWLGLDATLTFTKPTGVWAFPIQTVSQSEGGFELVHQSTAVVPHWHVRGDEQGRWEIAIQLKLDTSRAEARQLRKVPQ
jgi:alpha-amylase